MKSTKTTRTLGLTMVELLVIMGVCAALAGLALPFLFRAREGARIQVCKSNLMNVGGAFHMIMMTRQGYFTNSFYDITPVGTDNWWVGLRNEGAGTDPLMQQPLSGSIQCPSARGYLPVACARDGAGTIVNDAPASYAYNVEMPIIASNLNRVPDRTNRALFYDGDPALLVGHWKHEDDWANETILPRHRGEANFLLLDGHVDTVGEFSAYRMHGCERFARPDEITVGPLAAAPEFAGLSTWVLQSDTLEIHQESMNVKSQGNFLQCTIRISGADGVPVDLSTVYMLGVVGHPFKEPVPATSPMKCVVKEDGRLLVQLKFDQQVVFDHLVAGNHFGKEVGMKVIGHLENGRPFEGVDPNCVFNPPKDEKIK